MTAEHEDIIQQIQQSADYFTKAKLIDFLVHQKHVKIKDLASALHMKQAYLCHIMRLVKISEIIMDGYYANLISISHLFVLSLLPSSDDMVRLYEEILRDNLTVLQTEDRVRAMRYGVQPGGTYVDPASIIRLQSAIQNRFHAEVKVVQTRIKSKAVLTWNGTRQERKKNIEEFIKALGEKPASDSQ